jgi:hypothetical protein
MGNGGKDVGTGDRSGTVGRGFAGIGEGLIGGAGGFTPVGSPTAGKGKGGVLSSSSDRLSVGLGIAVGLGAGEPLLELTPGKGLPNSTVSAGSSRSVSKPFANGETIGGETIVLGVIKVEDTGRSTGGATEGKALSGDRLFWSDSSAIAVRGTVDKLTGGRLDEGWLDGGWLDGGWSEDWLGD